jgi:hypothetical protein
MNTSSSTTGEANSCASPRPRHSLTPSALAVDASVGAERRKRSLGDLFPSRSRPSTASDRDRTDGCQDRETEKEKKHKLSFTLFFLLKTFLFYYICREHFRAKLPQPLLPRKLHSHAIVVCEAARSNKAAKTKTKMATVFLLFRLKHK